MTIKVCDVCYHETNEVLTSTYRIGFKGSIKIDVCNVHQHYFQGLNSAEANKKYASMVSKSYEEMLTT